jgi:hypothetical protein
VTAPIVCGRALVISLFQFVPVIPELEDVGIGWLHLAVEYEFKSFGE